MRGDRRWRAAVAMVGAASVLAVACSVGPQPSTLDVAGPADPRADLRPPPGAPPHAEPRAPAPSPTTEHDRATPTTTSPRVDAPDAPVVTSPPDGGASGSRPAPPSPTPADPAPVVASAAPAGGGGVWAVVIGVDDYPGTDRDLRFAVADADTIDAALGHLGVPAARRTVLRDGQATRAGIVRAISDAAARAGPGSTLVVAYAGHVIRTAPGTEAIYAADAGLLHDHELAALLSGTRARHVWVVMASCYGAAFDEVLGPGRILTAATGPDDVVFESALHRGSFLVHFMFKRGWLGGEAGDSVQSAFEFAHRTISRSDRSVAPVQIDQVGAPLRIGGDGTGPARPVPAVETPPEPTAPPPKKTCLLILCSS